MTIIITQTFFVYSSRIFIIKLVFPKDAFSKDQFLKIVTSKLVFSKNMFFKDQFLKIETSKTLIELYFECLFVKVQVTVSAHCRIQTDKLVYVGGFVDAGLMYAGQLLDGPN